MLAGTPGGEPLNWKWNRILVPPFYLNSWQQDYWIPGLNNLGWCESAYAVQFSSTSNPKPIYPLETRRDVMLTTAQQTNAAKLSWAQNDTMEFGQWGVSQALSSTGQLNPGPGVMITNPLGQTAQPLNPTTCIKDAFGNLWTVTQYGTCGAINPFLTNTTGPNAGPPIYPTLTTTTIVATTVTDGSVVWTAVNPKGQGIRINPEPSQTGPVWQINVIGQARVAKYTSLGQYLDPVPDDYYMYFKDGFFAQLYRRSPDPKVRAKFAEEWKLWLMNCDNAVRQGSRELDDWGFVPSTNVMDTGFAFNPVTPSLPYGFWAGG